MEILIAENESVRELLQTGLGTEENIFCLTDAVPLILAHTPWESIYVCAGGETEAYVSLAARRKGEKRSPPSLKKLRKELLALRWQYIEKKRCFRRKNQVWRVCDTEMPRLL